MPVWGWQPAFWSISGWKKLPRIPWKLYLWTSILPIVRQLKNFVGRIFILIDSCHIIRQRVHAIQDICPVCLTRFRLKFACKMTSLIGVFPCQSPRICFSWLTACQTSLKSLWAENGVFFTHGGLQIKLDSLSIKLDSCDVALTGARITNIDWQQGLVSENTLLTLFFDFFSHPSRLSRQDKIRGEIRIYSSWNTFLLILVLI